MENELLVFMKLFDLAAAETVKSKISKIMAFFIRAVLLFSKNNNCF